MLVVCAVSVSAQGTFLDLKSGAPKFLQGDLSECIAGHWDFKTAVVLVFKPACTAIWERRWTCKEQQDAMALFLQLLIKERPSAHTVNLQADRKRIIRRATLGPGGVKYHCGD